MWNFSDDSKIIPSIQYTKFKILSLGRALKLITYQNCKRKSCNSIVFQFDMKKK